MSRHRVTTHELGVSARNKQAGSFRLTRENPWNSSVGLCHQPRGKLTAQTNAPRERTCSWRNGAPVAMEHGNKRHGLCIATSSTLNGLQMGEEQGGKTLLGPWSFPLPASALWTGGHGRLGQRGLGSDSGHQ